MADTNASDITVEQSTATGTESELGAKLSMSLDDLAKINKKEAKQNAIANKAKSAAKKASAGSGGGKKKKATPKASKKASPYAKQQQGSKSVHIGNLHQNVVWQDLKELCSKQKLKCQRAEILTFENGTLSGFGLITFANAKDARAAAEKLNNKSLRGKNITASLAFVPVNKKTAKAAKAKPQGKKNGKGTEGRQGNHVLFVGNLNNDCTDGQLKSRFSAFGNILACAVQKRPNGKSKGFGLVSFQKKAMLNQALESANGKTFMGRVLKLKLDNGK